MRILILGVSGLIGHKLFQELSSCFEVFGTLHKSKKEYGNINLFSGKNVIENINILKFEVLSGVISAINPDVIINCIGITKRKVDVNDLVDVIIINSIFPHKLAYLAKINNIRLIHFSTDCVFNGKIGNYSETSLTSAEDIYGRTKAFGEICYNHSLTIRSSFIGQELFDKTELLEWFLSQNGNQIKGYTNTFYSGVSVIFMAKFIKDIILYFPSLSGLYNLSTEKPISKYDLLSLAKEAFNLNIDIVPDNSYFHNPTLDSSKLKKEIKLKIPSWKEMMKELALNRNYYYNV